MKLTELIAFIDWTLSDKVGGGSYNRDIDKNVRILSQALKVSEEAGELSSEVLGYFQFVRKEKLDNYSQETLESEIADVIISTLRLARYLDLDIEKLLDTRVKKLQERISGEK